MRTRSAAIILPFADSNFVLRKWSLVKKQDDLVEFIWVSSSSQQPVLWHGES